MALLLAAVDWTVVAAATVTGATAIVVGLLGLYQSRLTASVAKHQIDGEMARLLAEHKETHFQHRQGVYHNFLNHERKLEGLVYTQDPLRRADFVNWQLNFLEQVSGVVLFGNEEVGRQAIQLQAVQSELNDLIEKQEGNLLEQIQAAYVATADKRIAVRRALVDAMRRDVAADQLPLSTWPALSSDEGVAQGVEGSTDVSEPERSEQA